MSDAKMVELEVPGRSVALANKLLHALTPEDLNKAGFDDQDIDDFAEFFEEVRYQAENNELCLDHEKGENL